MHAKFHHEMTLEQDMVNKNKIDAMKMFLFLGADAHLILLLRRSHRSFVPAYASACVKLTLQWRICSCRKTVVAGNGVISL